MVIVCFFKSTSFLFLHSASDLFFLFSRCKVETLIAGEYHVFSNGRVLFPIVEKMLSTLTNSFITKDLTSSCRVNHVFDFLDGIHRKVSAFAMFADIGLVLCNMDTIYLVLGDKRLNPGVRFTHSSYHIHGSF